MLAKPPALHLLKKVGIGQPVPRNSLNGVLCWHKSNIPTFIQQALTITRRPYTHAHIIATALRYSAEIWTDCFRYRSVRCIDGATRCVHINMGKNDRCMLCRSSTWLDTDPITKTVVVKTPHCIRNNVTSCLMDTLELF